MRLIDADAVSAAIEKLMYPAPNRDSILYNCGVNDALNAIEDAETVDAVQVARCRDCEYSDELPWPGGDDTFCSCHFWLADTRKDGFCSGGVRKEETSNETD